MPWVHYVPIKVDFSDLHDAMAFFRGLPDGTPGRDDLAQRIGEAGRDWVNQYWRIEVRATAFRSAAGSSPRHRTLSRTHGGCTSSSCA